MSQQPYRRLYCELAPYPPPEGEKREGRDQIESRRKELFSEGCPLPRALLLQFLPPGADLYNLIDPLVLWKLKVILLRNRRRDETGSGIRVTGSPGVGGVRYDLPSTDEVTPLKVLYQGLWSGQADENRRVERASDT